MNKIWSPLLVDDARISNNPLVRRSDLSKIIKEAGVTGIQLIYFANDKVQVHNLGFLQDRDPSLVTTATIFCAASLSKSVFAYAVLRLFDRGIIDLDRPLLKYIGNYNRFASHNHDFKSITARMVLRHTSGLPNWSEGPTVRLIFTPDTYYLYSGEGYLFLQKVIEQTLGRPLNEIMRDEVFAPLNMSNSAFLGANQPPLNASGLDLEVPNAAFSLSTNAFDYYKFLKAILIGDGLSSVTHKAMLAETVHVKRFYPPPTVYDEFLNWGLGVGLQTNEKGKAIWHWGDMNDYQCFYIAFPANHEGLVFFTQSTSGLKITADVINLFLGQQNTWAIKCLDYG